MTQNLVALLASYGDKPFMIFDDESYSYAWLVHKIDWYSSKISGINAFEPVVLEADFEPHAIALWFAMVMKNAILLPLVKSQDNQLQVCCRVAGARSIYRIQDADITIEITEKSQEFPEYEILRTRSHAGLVLFSSGSTGEPKAIVHDLSVLLEKYATPKRAFRTIPFLLFDHIGGIHSMLYALSSGGCLVAVPNRQVNTVLETLSKHQVDLLPTSPTFLKLILMSGGLNRYNLSCLKLVTYGTEPMPEPVLRNIQAMLPHVSFQQTYGLSEVGIMKSKSKSDGTLWLKLGGEGFETRIKGGVLQIKSDTAMLGYLNAPSPFTDDGWLDTKDEVIQNGDYVKIVGRKSEFINVGGEKVHPAEVESMILEISGVLDVTVYSKKSLVGETVCADVLCEEDVDHAWLRMEIKKHCSKKLSRFKVPGLIKMVDHCGVTNRFKKNRHFV